MLDYINDAFLAKLYGYSRWRLRGTSYDVKGKSFEDFAHEAIALVLGGTREIPEWVKDSDTALKFLTSVVCSLVSNNFSSKKNEPPAIAFETMPELSMTTDSEQRLIESQEAEAIARLMHQLRKELSGKCNALRCLDAYNDIEISEAGGQINKLIAAKTNLSVADVVAAKKQIDRTLKSIKDGKK